MIETQIWSPSTVYTEYTWLAGEQGEFWTSQRTSILSIGHERAHIIQINNDEDHTVRIFSDLKTKLWPWRMVIDSVVDDSNNMTARRYSVREWQAWTKIELPPTARFVFLSTGRDPPGPWKVHLRWVFPKASGNLACHVTTITLVVNSIVIGLFVMVGIVAHFGVRWLVNSIALNMDWLKM